MSWIIFAVLTILSYALFDFFIKLSSERIHAGLGGLIINSVSALVLLVFVVFLRFKGEVVTTVRPGGVFYSLIAGILIGLATIFFMKMFATGVNLSIGIPFVRIGIVLLASLLGVFLLKEGVTARYLIGFLLSLLGLYFLIAK